MSEEVQKTCSVKVTPEQEKWVCLCYLCLPNAREICELIPDLWLFENEGLMAQPGHGMDDALFLFPDKPWPDPDRDCVHKNDEIAALSDKWVDTVTNWDVKVLLPPEDGYFLVKSCREAGYGDWEKDPEAHRLMLMWLYNFAGKKLVELECQHDQKRDCGEQLDPYSTSATQAEGSVVDGSGSGSQVEPERPGELSDYVADYGRV